MAQKAGIVPDTGFRHGSRRHGLYHGLWLAGAHSGPAGYPAGAARQTGHFIDGGNEGGGGRQFLGFAESASYHRGRGKKMPYPV